MTDADHGSSSQTLFTARSAVALPIALAIGMAASSGSVLTAQESKTTDDDLFRSVEPEPPLVNVWTCVGRNATRRFFDREEQSTPYVLRTEIDRRLAQWVELQNDDGSFGTETEDRLRITALTVLAFSLRGHTFDAPDHGPLLRRAVEWMVAHLTRDGRFVVDGVEAGMRSQAQATFALIDTSYSPDYPRTEYPGVAAFARRAVAQLDGMRDADIPDIWRIATEAYAVRAALRESRTEGAPAAANRLDWPSSVRQFLTISGDRESSSRLKDQLSAEVLEPRFLGADLDEAVFATRLVDLVHSPPMEAGSRLRSWIHEDGLEEWEAPPREIVELDEHNLLRTLQLAARYLLLPSKQR